MKTCFTVTQPMYVLALRRTLAETLELDGDWTPGLANSHDQGMMACGALKVELLPDIAELTEAELAEKVQVEAAALAAEEAAKVEAAALAAALAAEEAAKVEADKKPEEPIVITDLDEKPAETAPEV